jgi:hypothetical protein
MCECECVCQKDDVEIYVIGTELYAFCQECDENH